MLNPSHQQTHRTFASTAMPWGYSARTVVAMEKTQTESKTTALTVLAKVYF